MKCERCGEEATLVQDTDNVRYCDECFNEIFAYNSTEHDKCSQCGNKLPDNEFYLSKDMYRFCSRDCMITFYGFQKV